MWRGLRYAFFGLIGLLALGTVLVIAEADPQPVPATVSRDPSLPRLEVAGVTLHAQRFGPDEAPAVVVLHGGPGADHRSLLPLRALAPGYHVVFYDQRGAGLSERAADPALTLEGHLEELDGVLRAVSPDKPAVLIGHSWGATLATAYLGRHPDRVTKAVLIEPGFLDAAGLAAWEDRAGGLIRGMLLSPAGLFDMGVTVAEAMMLDGPDADALQDYVTGHMVMRFADHPDTPYHCPGAPYDSPAWRFGARTQAALPASATPADLDAVAGAAGDWDGAALFLTGGCNDWIGTPLQTRHMAFFRDARLVEVPGAGHDVVDDRPEAALAAIRGFLDSG